MESRVDDQRSHSHDRDTRNGFGQDVIRLENHNHRAIQMQENNSSKALMEPMSLDTLSQTSHSNMI